MYCNYSRGKFGSELTFIIPSWTDLINSGDKLSGKYPADRLFIESLEQAEYKYMRLLDEGWKPQQARQVLPNALKTEIMMCGFEDDYKHFFDLRVSEAAHPSMRQVAYMMYSKLYPTINANE